MVKRNNRTSVMSCLFLMIYAVDGAIHLLNNWGQIKKQNGLVGAPALTFFLTLFRARKVTGTFEIRAAGPYMFRAVFKRGTNPFGIYYLANKTKLCVQSKIKGDITYEVMLITL